MKKANLISAVFTIVFFAVFSCSVKGQTQSKTKSSNTISKKEKDVKFIIKVKEDAGSGGMPLNNISLSVGGKVFFIYSLTGWVTLIDEGLKDTYKDTIPKNAIVACIGSSPGLSDYFYVIRSKKGFSVFHGSMDEGREEEDYYWKKIKTINVR